MTTYTNRCVTYFQALSQWGLENQLLVAIEEMSEVQKAITKLVRASEGNHEDALNNLAEEIADATIMLEQLRYIYGIDDKVAAMMDNKIFRLEERISNGTD
jgi:NTP pyrophosphatase (non-canonical NTP hydrolase)